jgi:hypothetical protein
MASGDARAAAQRQESGCPGQLQPGEQAAQILALLKRDRTAVDLGDIADDGEAEAGAGLAGIEPGAAIEDRLALALGDAGAVVLDLDLHPFGRGADRDEDPALAIFGGVLNEVAEQLVEVLPLTLASAALSPAMSMVTFS